MISKKLLTAREAAAMLGVSKTFLDRDRWSGATIPFVRIGTRTDRYNPDVIHKVREKQTSASMKV